MHVFNLQIAPKDAKITALPFLMPPNVLIRDKSGLSKSLRLFQLLFTKIRDKKGTFEISVTFFSDFLKIL